MTRKTRQLTTAESVAARVNAQMKQEGLVSVASDPAFTVSRMTTGSLTMDRLTNGGFARGRHIELFGDWSSGKSLLVYRTLAEAQARGETCALIDAERVFDEAWFTYLGGDPDQLIKYRPKTAEVLGSVLQLFVQRSAEVEGIDVVGVDSVATLLPTEELKKNIEDGDDRVGSLARLMSRLLRRITSQNDGTTFIWTNQWRDKISRIPGQRSTPGGHALSFYASTRIEMRLDAKETSTKNMAYRGKMSDQKIVTGQWVNSLLKKDKTGARPGANASFLFDYERKAVDIAQELIDIGMQDGIIVRRGDYYEYEDYDGHGYRWHGITRAKNAIRDIDGLQDELVALIQAQTEELSTGGGGGDDDQTAL